MSEGNTSVKNLEVKNTRNFKQSQDIETFYRFIHEHDLRREALQMLSHIHKTLDVKKTPKKRGRKPSKSKKPTLH